MAETDDENYVSGGSVIGPNPPGKDPHVPTPETGNKELGGNSGDKPLNP